MMISEACGDPEVFLLYRKSAEVRRTIGEGAAEHRELTGRRADKGRGSAEDGSKSVFIIPQNSYLTFHLYFLAINYAFNNLD